MMRRWARATLAAGVLRRCAAVTLVVAIGAPGCHSADPVPVEDQAGCFAAQLPPGFARVPPKYPTKRATFHQLYVRSGLEVEIIVEGDDGPKAPISSFLGTIPFERLSEEPRDIGAVSTTVTHFRGSFGEVPMALQLAVFDGAGRRYFLYATGFADERDKLPALAEYLFDSFRLLESCAS